MELYLDDSGSRFPDRSPGPEQANGMDYFALGGILFEARKIPDILRPYKALCEKWHIDYPLHSNSIRFRSASFTWLAGLNDAERARFFEDIDMMIDQQPFLAIACVVHRPGYNARYKELYGNERWRLCKTAYSIVVERAGKFADGKTLPLRVHFETSGKREDKDIILYHRELKKSAAPFDADRSSKYTPLDAQAFGRVLLGDPEQHAKKSRFCQLADLVLYPIAKGRYAPDYRPYRHLKEKGKLIDCVIRPDEIDALGIKYSCFDQTETKEG